ncbi:MAG: hypothetical protein BalsKO_08810 [Balneolaceae bacterium]
MKSILFFSILAISITNCSSNNSSGSIFEGDFSGTFYRVNDNIRFQTAEVSLTFNNGTFEGTSTINEYPAICNGTFEVGEDEVTFSNDCVFTADFDWTYILDGSFNYEVTDNELRIIREYNSSSSDTYTLIGEN